MHSSAPPSPRLSRSSACLAAIGLFAGLACHQALAQDDIAQHAMHAEAKSPITGSLALVTDYRFRGISQTWRGAAVQGGVELALPHGGYLGTWLSNVSSNSYPQGQSLEHDIYGGWRGEVASGWQMDAGMLHYRYPGARLSAAGGGSQYLDLNYQHPMADWGTLGLHGGYTHVRNYGEVSYADWRLSLAKTWGAWTGSVAWVGTSADARYYSAVNDSGQMRSLGRSGWVLGLSAGF